MQATGRRAWLTATEFALGLEARANLPEHGSRGSKRRGCFERVGVLRHRSTRVSGCRAGVMDSVSTAAAIQGQSSSRAADRGGSTEASGRRASVEGTEFVRARRLERSSRELGLLDYRTVTELKLTRMGVRMSFAFYLLASSFVFK